MTWARAYGIAAAIAIWGLIAGILSVTGRLETFSGAALLIAGLFPAAIWLVAYTFSETFRETMLALPLRALTILEASKFLGGVFILWEFSQGLLPAGFAMPTGISDIALGLSAIPAAYLLLDDAGRPKPGFLLWHSLSLIFLLISSTSGIITSPIALTFFPASLIPVFLGPMMILIELTAIARILEGRAIRPVRTVPRARFSA